MLKVHFMNHILAIRKEDGDFLNTGDVLDIANGWHRCGIEAGRDVVPKFVHFREESDSDIRVQFTGKCYCQLLY